MSGIYVRVCYENGNPATGKKVYELHKICDCEYCKKKFYPRKRRNSVTATTKDENKIPEIKEFLKMWKCKDKTKDIPTEYFSF